MRDIPRPRQPRESNITVVVRPSDEEIDFDAWAERYLHAILAADRTATDGTCRAEPPSGRSLRGEA
jgi:hypothetical protein